MIKQRLMTLLIVVLGTCLLAPVVYAQRKSGVDPEGHQWWQHAVFYEIYPRSFADSNKDGIGDLRGITSKLGYLHDLGVDAVWLTPCYPSPQVDFGYDVSDYEDIDPMYGTLTDFDAMVKGGQQHGVRIIMDFVLNHTSDQHRWFLDSKSSKTSAHRDWYIWRNGQANGQPPNNWTSIFGGSAWKIDPTTNQYYYHLFYEGQPDLNWRNPAVEKAMYDTTRWWYERGVSGFRLDAVGTMLEDPDLRDNPLLPGTNALGDRNQERKYNTEFPEVHEALRDLRKIADEYNAVLIGETVTGNIDDLKRYYGDHGNELQMPMNFMFAYVNQLSPAEFRKQIAAIDGSGGWPVFVLSNHDSVRHYNRYGNGKNNDQIAKLMATLYLTLRGTPVMYYGEEIGMENNDPKRREDVQDPVGRLGWPKDIGRDGERTPMQWNDSNNAGFSESKPWLPVPPSYKTHNVEAESKDPGSILNRYKALISLRKTNDALREGRYVALNEGDANVLSYLRTYKGHAVLVVLNMSDQPQKPTFDLSRHGFPTLKTKALLDSQGTKVNGQELSLEPFATFVAEVTK